MRPRPATPPPPSHHRHRPKFENLADATPPHAVDRDHATLVPVHEAQVDAEMDAALKRYRPNGVPTSLHPALQDSSTLRGTRNHTIGSHGGQFGTYIYSSYGTSGGSFGANTGYMSTEVWPIAGTNTLFAPTNKGADRACLEVGTGYNYRLQGAQVYAYDFCDGTALGTLYTMNFIDAGFRKNYERNYGDGCHRISTRFSGIGMAIGSRCCSMPQTECGNRFT